MLALSCVMPKAAHIYSRDGIVGTMFFRYHDEIVDCGSPERSESWYSVQPRSSRYFAIRSRISFNTFPPNASIVRKLYFIFSLQYNSLCRIIITIYTSISQKNPARNRRSNGPIQQEGSGDIRWHLPVYNEGSSTGRPGYLSIRILPLSGDESWSCWCFPWIATYRSSHHALAWFSIAEHTKSFSLPPFLIDISPLLPIMWDKRYRQYCLCGKAGGISRRIGGKYDGYILRPQGCLW